MAAWCYILLCADDTYYTGCTTNLDARMGRHRAGSDGGYTARRLPVEMVWAAEFDGVHDAIDMERRIKRWTHAKKAAFIAGDWTRLQALASRGKRRDAALRNRAADTRKPSDGET